MENQKIKVGDLFHSNYSYGMILNYFYEVKAVTPKGVKIVEVDPYYENTYGDRIWQGSFKIFKSENGYPPKVSPWDKEVKPKFKKLNFDKSGNPWIKINRYQVAYLVNDFDKTYWEDHLD